MTIDPENCAHVILDVIPLVMRLIRSEMRRYGSAELSIPQFRALTFINRHPGVSLLEVANHLGLTPPSTSNLVDDLVKRRLVLRQTSTTDRRRITLCLTPEGETLIKIARQGTQARLADILKEQSPANLDLVTQALLILQSVINEETQSSQELIAPTAAAYQAPAGAGEKE